MTRRIRAATRTVAAALLVTCVMGGCSASNSDAPPPHVLPAPSKADDCGKSVIVGGPDGGLLAGILFPGGDFDNSETAVAYACYHYDGATVRITPSGPGVVISPTTFATGDFPAGVTALHVRSTGIPGTVNIRFTLTEFNGHIAADFPAACTIQSDGQRWHFSKPSY